MMTKQLVRFWLSSILLLCLTSKVFAADLLQVYQQALQSDPTFRAAESAYLAAKENLPISQAALLPNIGLNAGVTRSHIDNNTKPNPNNTYYNTDASYSLSITQPLFNFASWMVVRNAVASVKQAEATYYAAQQDLMLRVATAYFNILQAYDNLRTTQAQKKALAQQLEQTEQRYKVGLIAVTGVQQIKANYDATVAQEIAARNTLSDRLEELRAITGVFYPTLAGLKANLPLIKPVPADINEWVDVASQQNYTLQAANFATLAARENVKVKGAGHLPVINATGGYTSQDQNNYNGAGFSQRLRAASVGVNVNLPIYQGGLISAQTRQAADLYAQAAAQQEQAYRSTVTRTRESYLGVISGISKLQADEQAIISNQTALKATQAAYIVGTNTIVDVLVQQSNLFNSQQNYTADQYAYLLNTLALKQAAGTLSESDLAIINSWLGKQENFSSFDATRADTDNFYPMSYRGTTKHNATKPKAVVKEKVPAAQRKYPLSMNKELNQHEKYLISANKAHYVIQLYAGDSIKDANYFIRVNKLQDKAKYFQLKKDGVTKYPVVYGNYATRVKATAALRELPAKFQKHQPWVRSFASIQQALTKGA